MNGPYAKGLVTFLLCWGGLAAIVYGLSGPVGGGVVLIFAGVLLGWDS